MSLLPPGARCTALWYLSAVASPQAADQAWRRELAARAVRIARWYQVPPWPPVPEGPGLAVQLPEWCWTCALADMDALYSMAPLPFPGPDYPQRCAVATAWQLDG